MYLSQQYDTQQESSRKVIYAEKLPLHHSSVPQDLDQVFSSLQQHVLSKDEQTIWRVDLLVLTRRFCPNSRKSPSPSPCGSTRGPVATFLGMVRAFLFKAG